MSEKYTQYFDINPRYYASITSDLIEQGKVSWRDYYPHKTFVDLLETTYRVLSGSASRSIWVEGSYGTGKSHAALTVKSILDASREDVAEYFDENRLSQDLRDKFLGLKENSNILTVHRVGSAAIQTDLDLILAVQQSIMSALSRKGLKNMGDASMKEAFLQWIQKDAFRTLFVSLIAEPDYAFDFSGVTVESIIDQLTYGTDSQVEKMMSKVMKVLRAAGQYGIIVDVTQMAEWIRSVIRENHLTAILFVWDEFSEYFMNHAVGLTGFQTLAEISQSDPFYFLIVAHMSKGLFADKETANKTMDRFERPIEIKLPDSMAFQLMARAMRKTSDQMLLKKWESYANSMNEELRGVRSYIETATRNMKRSGNDATVLEDNVMRDIVPLHPYAALILTHIAILFNSNQRSMFDFIIGDNEAQGAGFRWFIQNYGPTDDQNLLTVDMLWNFFNRPGIGEEARSVLDNFDYFSGVNLLPEEQAVLKTVLLLQAVQLKVTGNDLLIPSQRNLELAFEGLETWITGRATAIANGLIEKKVLFLKPGGKEYDVASRNPSDLGEFQKKARERTTTQGLITDGGFIQAVHVPEAVCMRFLTDVSGADNLPSVIRKFKANPVGERFQAVITFAANENEAKKIRQVIAKQMSEMANSIIFIESLTPMGSVRWEEYIDNLALSLSNANKNNDLAGHYQSQASSVLDLWKKDIISGGFQLYTPEQPSGERKATMEDLQAALLELDFKKYYYGLERYELNGTMYTAYQFPAGAACGIEEKLSGSFKNANKKMSFENALEGAWGIPDYWKDQSKRGLTIVHVKKRVEELVNEGFASPNARVSFYHIAKELEVAPFGLMPMAVSALVLGFVLKEYCTPVYFWSNGTDTEPMTVDFMKKAIGNALTQMQNPVSRFKEEFIVTMGPELRHFLDGTNRIFHTGPLGSVEMARNRIRTAMSGLSFPIWSVRSILNQESLSTTPELVTEAIECYCGIANTANAGLISESELASRIGRAMEKSQGLVEDLEMLFTSENCRKGMLAYIDAYRDRTLPVLAAEIGDEGKYLDEVKSRISAGDANWVWNSTTVDAKIDDVILDYEIIRESKPVLGGCSTLREAMQGWIHRTNQIGISGEILERSTGNLGDFMKQLTELKKNGNISPQNRRKFYDALVAQREAFSAFYQDQLPVFRKIADSFLGGLSDEEIEALYQSFPTGLFAKSQSDYYSFINEEIKKFLLKQWKNKLSEKWKSKTHSKDPVAWSDKYETPILCLFDGNERAIAKRMLGIILSPNPKEQSAREAMEWLDKADFYDRMEQEEERDRCFARVILGDYAVLLKDLKEVRYNLKTNSYDRVYDWVDSEPVRECLRKMAEKQYKLTGCTEAQGVIDRLDAEQLRTYLRERIQSDLAFGIQLLKRE